MTVGRAVGSLVTLTLLLAPSSALAGSSLRDQLSIEEGRDAIASHTYTEGDEGGAVGTEVGRCERIGARVVECVVMAVEIGSSFGRQRLDYTKTSAPESLARAVLQADGVVTTELRPIEATRRAPALKVSVSERQRFGTNSLISARIRAVDAGRATVGATIFPARGRGIVVRATSRQLSAGSGWRVGLHPSARQARMVRRWLALNGRVTAHVETALSVDAGIAPATTKRVIETRLVR